MIMGVVTGDGKRSILEYMKTDPKMYAVLVAVVCLVILVAVFVTLRLKIKNQEYLTKLANLEQERYKVAAEICNDILFEYDVRMDTMQYADKYKEIFGRKPLAYHYTELMEEKDAIHPEDIGVFESYCRLLHKGKQVVEVEYRTKDVYNQYVWCHVKGKTIYDHLGHPLRIIGKLVNIDIQKKELERMQMKAQMDPFTNVYNKTVIKDKIENLLGHSRPQDKHAFIIIDIDDFKTINDKYGHLAGDQVLAKLVRTLKRMFRTEDLIGRVGGDEFVVFMTQITSREDVERKMEHFGSSIGQCYREDDPDIEITCSIGISIYPMDGDHYEQLLEKADKALYYIKNNGKRSYYIYQEQE